MATPLHTNAIKLFRRHTANCPIRKTQPRTKEPTTQAERNADTCTCPIYGYGHLRDETETKNGKLVPKQLQPFSLDSTTWEDAQDERLKAYKRGTILDPDAKPIDSTDLTIDAACELFLNSRSEAGADPLEDSSLELYVDLFELRLKPYCRENKIKFIKHFADEGECEKFILSWRNLQSKTYKLLGQQTKKQVRRRFNDLLKLCVRRKKMQSNGMADIKVKLKAEDEADIHGLELDEYEDLLLAPPSPQLSDEDNYETLVAAKVMRWVGMRVSDCCKFNVEEIKRNEQDTGWIASFIQKKTKTLCESPMSEDMHQLLMALPGHLRLDTFDKKDPRVKKYFFKCSNENSMSTRLCRMAVRAQEKRGKKFAGEFSTHVLRHTMSIQNFNNFVPVAFVSKWLGHSDESITTKTYKRWIRTTGDLADAAFRESIALTALKVAALNAEKALEPSTKPN